MITEKPQTTSYHRRRMGERAPTQERPSPFDILHHVHTYNLNNTQAKTEYYLLAYHLSKDLISIIEAAEEGKSFLIGSVGFSTKCKQGSLNKIVVVEGSFGAIYLLLQLEA